MGNRQILSGEILTTLEKYKKEDGYYYIGIYTKDLEHIINCVERRHLGDEYYFVVLCFSTTNYINTYIYKNVNVYDKFYSYLVELDKNTTNFRLEYHPVYCRAGLGFNLTTVYPKIDFFRHMPKYDYFEALELLGLF